MKSNKSPSLSTMLESPPGARLNKSRAHKEAIPSPTLNQRRAHKEAVPQHAGPDRAYFTSDANCDVTSVISTPAAVQEHVIYTAYGITTITNSSWSASADTLAVRTGWQGGESMSWINGWAFQNRIELANLNVWMTADPIMAGLNYYAYCADNPINTRDPSGLEGEPSRPTRRGGYPPTGHYLPVQRGRPNPVWVPPVNSAFCNKPNKAGVDITDNLRSIERELTQEFHQASETDQAFILLSSESLVGWDISDLMSKKSRFGGTGEYEETVTVAGHVYRAEQVNYFLWGLHARLQFEYDQTLGYQVDARSVLVGILEMLHIQAPLLQMDYE